jgi:DNA polymerase-1
MISSHILIYFPDPFGVGGSRYAIGMDGGLNFVTSQELENFKSVITFEAPALIDDLRRSEASIPEQIIDISDAIRLCTGISRADGGERKWNFWKKIRPFFRSDDLWDAAKGVHSGQDTIDNHDIDVISKALYEAIIGLWENVSKELFSLGEEDRFWHIEMPAAQPFYQRQRNGISIEHDLLEGLMNKASSIKYTCYQEVSKTLNVSATGLTYWNVAERLKSIDIGFPVDGISGYALRDQMKMASHKSNFARSFTDYLDASRDMDILSRLLEDDGKVYPTFHPVGTISSRVLVSDPYLQELKRRYRGIIAPDKGHVLRYFDYSQFEPGIMASLSNDQDLLNLYNEGDIYKSLSVYLFGSDLHRSLCKRIFLAFSYGMSSKGIAMLLSDRDSTPEARDAIRQQVEDFFSKFKKLVLFKIDLENQLLSTGRIASARGNHRYRQQTGKLSPKERRWAVSQVIQGTASLIFKHAIVDISQKFGANSMILPMHDAILMQFPVGSDQDKNEMEVVQIMKNAFNKYCPGINGRVTADDFAS